MSKEAEIKKFYEELQQFEMRLARMQDALRKMFVESAMRRHNLDLSDLDAKGHLNDSLNKLLDEN